MKRFVSITENFLSEESLSMFYAFARASKLYDASIDFSFWSGKIIHLQSTPSFVTDECKKLLYELQSKIQIDFELDNKIYADTFTLIKWLENTSHDLHAPAENLDGTITEFFWRKYGCILFLNDDFDGGEIEFPNQNIRFKPKANTLIIYPGDIEFAHKKHEVKNNTRYVIDSYWTDDISKRLEI